MARKTLQRSRSAEGSLVPERGTGALIERRAAVWRLLDANANRAREGLRIIEDTARFVLNRGSAAKAVRAMRHELDALVRKHYKQLLSARDVASDSGRSNAAAGYEGGVSDLLAANFKRCEEALRVLEEYGRVLSPQAVSTAQSLRFKIYAMEKTLVLALR
jgi:thiamine-phosphate pyrophosphorylase